MLVAAPDTYQLVLIERPNVPEAELRDAARWRIQEYLEFPAADAVIDVFPFPDGAAVFALLLAAYSIYGLVAISRVDDQSKGLAKQVATLADGNAKARASINLVEDPKLAARVAGLRAELGSRTVLVAALSGTTNGRSAGFAKHMFTPVVLQMIAR